MITATPYFALSQLVTDSDTQKNLDIRRHDACHFFRLEQQHHDTLKILLVLADGYFASSCRLPLGRASSDALAIAQYPVTVTSSAASLIATDASTLRTLDLAMHPGWQSSLVILRPVLHPVVTVPALCLIRVIHGTLSALMDYCDGIARLAASSCCKPVVQARTRRRRTVFQDLPPGRRWIFWKSSICLILGQEELHGGIFS